MPVKFCLPLILLFSAGEEEKERAAVNEKQIEEEEKHVQVNGAGHAEINSVENENATAGAVHEANRSSEKLTGWQVGFISFLWYRDFYLLINIH